MRVSFIVVAGAIFQQDMALHTETCRGGATLAGVIRLGCTLGNDAVSAAFEGFGHPAVITVAAAVCGTGSPCAACKSLRRKCQPDCVFAPYFSTDQGAARFAAIHKVFGASNASKLLSHLPVADRCEAVVTITYEAQARLRDPVYGCVGVISILQHNLRQLQQDLARAKDELSNVAIPTADPLNLDGIILPGSRVSPLMSGARTVAV